MEFNVGDMVKVNGERGRYRVYRSEPHRDGSILLYGGDPNPNGVRGFRSVMPERLSVDRQKGAGKIS